jgi:hypothetical protein
MVGAGCIGQQDIGRGGFELAQFDVKIWKDYWPQGLHVTVQVERMRTAHRFE